jgi:hypothetical protein
MLPILLLASCSHATPDASCAHPKTGRIVGQVVDHHGRPVAGAPITLTADEGDVAYNYTTRKDGRFDLGCLSAADYVVGSGTGSEHVHLRAQQRVEIKLRIW